jgi:hypothetical protein
VAVGKDAETEGVCTLTLEDGTQVTLCPDHLYDIKRKGKKRKGAPVESTQPKKTLKSLAIHKPYEEENPLWNLAYEFFTSGECVEITNQHSDFVGYVDLQLRFLHWAKQRSRGSMDLLATVLNPQHRAVKQLVPSGPLEVVCTGIKLIA